MSKRNRTEGGPARTTWFSMNRPRPELPYYFRPGKRLKGLEEFQTPEFVGRMARVQRRRAAEWWAMLACAAVLGAALGLALL